jgi:hypothetical protein
MRGVRSSLVALVLSLLMVSTSVSASACDLSCWLHQAHADCLTVGSVTADKDGAAMSMPSDMDMHPVESERMVGAHIGADATAVPMSMPADMDMGPDDSNSMASSDANLNARPGQTLAMPPQLEGVTESFGRAAKAEMGTRAMLNHSGTLSSCMHEPCSQTSMSVSPPTGDHSQTSSLHWMPIGISNPVSLWIGFHWIRPGTPPAKILAVDHLTTTLRI